jgi:hypothetical protein
MLNEKYYTIKKAKYDENKGLRTEYTLLEHDGDESTNTEVTVLSPRQAHPDLVRAFKELIPHLILLTESIEGKSLDDVSKDLRFKNFEARSFSIGGNDEHRGVIISGVRTLNGNRVISLNTPFTRFEPNTELGVYEYLDELQAAVETCIDEIKLFLEGKHAVNPQLQLFETAKA